MRRHLRELIHATVTPRAGALILLVLLGGCGAHVYHVVQPGETMYSIGFTYGHDYHDVARWNNIHPPYALKPGQRLRVAPVGRSQGATVVDMSERKPELATKSAPPASQPVVRAAPATNNVTVPADVAAAQSTEKFYAENQQINWRWPARNRTVLKTFLADDPARQGVDIGGEQGAPVYAAADGYVVYAGSGLVRYGRLIIIKHNEKFLSAYAHNHALHVREGEAVKAGQQIADMGSSGTTQSKLHFEIRRDGKPVDPLRLLPR